MERQRSFSLKSTRFVVFSFTITSSIIFLTFFSFRVIKFTPFINQETHFQLSKPAVNVSLKPLTVQTLTGSRRNFTAPNAKNLILIDTPVNKLDKTSGFSNLSVSGDIQKEKNDTQAPKDEASKGDGLNVTSLSRGEESVPAPSLIEVQSNERLQEKKIGAASVEKIELPSDQQIKKENVRAASVQKVERASNKRIEEKKTRDCDITNGRWAYDESYPLYTNTTCPFIDEGFNCMSNGRLDKHYIKWKWQPHDCDIPRFNATKMLELIRVEYYVSHFLVHEGKARVGQKRVQTLRIDSIDHGSSRWRGADILIFNTAHWWSHYKTKAGINYYQEGDQVLPRLDVFTAFKRALMTWASWVDKRINPRKTQIFFRNSAPSHFRGGQWNAGGHCAEATQPLNEISGFSYPEKNVIIEDVIKQMRTPVTLLNITSLSEYRIDGHPSTYGRNKRYSSNIQDCSHWCLPGVPDTWNELLYFQLQSKKE
ncbi:protein trichome birefringence-like 6 [Citrus sinensis]|nr:protein trichome birefringence-like 6 [Citrus sinensis]